MSRRVVYDTMLFVQAASRPDRIHASFKAISDGQLTLCLSAELLAEIRDVLNRDSVRAKFPALTADVVDVFITDIIARATIVSPVPNAFTWPEHPTDDHLFNLAIAGHATYLVTWENRILKLETDNSLAAHTLRQLARNLSILSPLNLADKLRHGME